MSRRIESGGAGLRAHAMAIAPLAVIIATSGLAVLFNGCGGDMSAPETGSESTTISHEEHTDMTAPAEGSGAENAAAAQETLQKTCPVMGGPIDKNIYVDYKGRRIYFCCRMCVDSFNKDPEKYLPKLDAEIAAESPGESS